MKLGCCTDIKHSNIVKKAGFDFLECTVVSLMTENDCDFHEILKQHQQSKLPVKVCNVFLPGSLKIVGDTVDQLAIEHYVDKALSRVKQIGAELVVFGSGGARSLPEGFPFEKGEEQIVKFLNMVADIAEPLGITIVIEPLNKKESNIINSIQDAVSVARKVNRKGIQVLADFYHMEEEHEPLENIALAGDLIKHIHVADTGRFAPGTGDYPYKDFVHHINSTEYNGLISIECNWKNFEAELLDARRFLTTIFNENVTI